MKTPLKPKQAPLIKTQADLARELGISRQSLSKHMRDVEAPGITDVTGWTAFLAANGRSGSVPPKYRDRLARERIRLIKGQADRVDRENRIAEGKVLDLDKACALASQTSVMFCAELGKMEQELPPMLTGLDPQAIHAILTQRTDEVKARLSALFEQMKGPLA